MKRQQDCLSGVKVAVCRMNWIKKVITSEMISKAGLEDPLDDLENGREIGDRAVVGKVFLIKRRFLEKRSNNRLFELQREVSRSKTEVHNACGASMQQQCLRKEVGIASSPHCLLG